MQATLEMKQTHIEYAEGKPKIYNVWYRGRLIYIRSYGRKQIRDYFKAKERLRIGNIYECDSKWLWPKFDTLRGDVKFDLTA